MAIDDNLKLRMQMLCAVCRSDLEVVTTKLHDGAHYDVEVLIEPCQSCEPIEALPTKPFELVFNDSERVEVSLR